MSVYTSVEPDQLEQFLKRYDLGNAVDFKPIAAGITNSNYALQTDRGSFVLTLYEHHSDDELDYMLRLQCHLAEARCALLGAGKRSARRVFFELEQSAGGDYTAPRRC